MQPVLDPELLKAFVAVADHRSFTRAAAVLNRTQSAVSMQVKRLEDRLGVTLFQRTKTEVSISPAGEGLLGYARRILSLSDEAVGRVSDHKLEGVVRLGIIEDYGILVVPPLLASFARKYPRILIEMEIGLMESMPERLGHGCDLVIALHPSGECRGAFVRSEQAVWAAGPNYSTDDSEPLAVALYPHGCLFRKWATEALDRSGRRWRPAFVSHSRAAMIAIACQGLAVTVMKESTFPPELRRLSESDGMPALPRGEICLHRAPSLSIAASLLADHLVPGMAKVAEALSTAPVHVARPAALRKIGIV